MRKAFWKPKKLLISSIEKNTNFAVVKENCTISKKVVWKIVRKSKMNVIWKRPLRNKDLKNRAADQFISDWQTVWDGNLFIRVPIKPSECFYLTIRSLKFKILRRWKKFSSKHEVLSEYSDSNIRFIFSKS